jgi:hypothetical protein
VSARIRVPERPDDRGEAGAAAAPPREPHAPHGARLPKKGRGFLRQGQRSAFEPIESEKAHFPIRLLCRALEVTPARLYAWRRRPRPSPREEREAELRGRIHNIHAASRGTYGSPRVYAELKKNECRPGRLASSA